MGLTLGGSRVGDGAGVDVEVGGGSADGKGVRVTVGGTDVAVASLA